MKNLGVVIKRAIQQSPKMSLRKLEILAGVTRSEISLIINKKRKRPTPRVLRKLAVPLKLDYTYLYALAGYLDEEDYRRIKHAKASEQNSAETVREGITPYSKLSRRKAEILDMIQKLPDSEMPRVKDYLKLIQVQVNETRKERFRSKE